MKRGHILNDMPSLYYRNQQNSSCILSDHTLHFQTSPAAFFHLQSDIFIFYNCKKHFLPRWKTFLTWVENDFHLGKTILYCLRTDKKQRRCATTAHLLFMIFVSIYFNISNIFQFTLVYFSRLLSMPCNQVFQMTDGVVQSSPPHSNH